MAEPALQAAHMVAQRVEQQFARRIREAQNADELLIGPPPDAASVEAILEAAFWASLRREEGRFPNISLALLPSSYAGAPLVFEHALSLKPETLAKLAPAVERPGIHLGVSHTGGPLFIWGATRIIPPLCFVLEVMVPGLLVVKHRRLEDGTKYLNVAVIESDRVKMISEETTLPDCPEIVTSLRGPRSWTDSTNVLVQLAISMRAHARGGTLLVVPRDSDSWLESVVRPIPYAVAPPFSGLAVATSRTIEWAIDGIAGLTAVDGATILTDDYHLLAFGAKIVRRRAAPQVEQVLVTEPIENAEPEVVFPSELGGTRHLSAAQFVQDQKNALGLVASQDGRFTVFAWSPCHEKVHAHRVESLLM